MYTSTVCGLFKLTSMISPFNLSYLALIRGSNVGVSDITSSITTVNTIAIKIVPRNDRRLVLIAYPVYN